ncbi:MAG: RnfABCDGE type electron transport complex subunit G [Endomicrobiia bacterium]
MKTLNMIIVLFIVCCFSAVSLSFLYVKTQPRIQLNKVQKEVKLKKQIIPHMENFVVKSLEKLNIEECFDEKNTLIGILVKNSCKGYGGPIEYLVGIKPEVPLKIIGIKVLSHKETPGLGANVAKDKFLSQFIDKVPQELVLKKDNVQGKIDAITGATITSKAITNSLQELLLDEELNKYILSLSKVQQEHYSLQIKPQRMQSNTKKSSFSAVLEQLTTTYLQQEIQPQQ